jgi:hypothetical protein
LFIIVIVHRLLHSALLNRLPPFLLPSVQFVSKILYTLLANGMGSARDLSFKMLYFILILTFAYSGTLDFFIRAPLPKSNRIPGVKSGMSEDP